LTDRNLADALVHTALSRCLNLLTATGCRGEANRLPSSELWRVAGALLDVGTLQHHARFKPHGYAGDYEMLTRICRQSCCDHPLGAAFDRYFLSQAAPQAVLARTWQTAAALSAHCLECGTGPYRAVSVGSGPAIDLQEAAGMLPQKRREQLQVTLLDLDPAALGVARDGLERLLSPGSLDCVRANLYRLTSSAEADAMGSPDFLVCSGLFDYLDDDSAASMLQLFWRRLAAGALLLVGNFAPHNPTRAYMEWIGNWYLTYRTAEQLERLAVRAEIPRGQFTIGSERLGVDLFLVGRKAG